MFYPMATEMASTWHYQVIELVTEIGKCTNITSYPKEMVYLFQQLAMALQRRFSFQSTFAASQSLAARYFLFYLMSVCLLGCCQVGLKNNYNKNSSSNNKNNKVQYSFLAVTYHLSYCNMTRLINNIDGELQTIMAVFSML